MGLNRAESSAAHAPLFRMKRERRPAQSSIPMAAQASHHWPVSPSSRSGNSSPQVRHLHRISESHLSGPVHIPAIPAGIGNAIDAVKLRQLAKANEGKRGFTYSHKPPTGSNLSALRAANRAGFVVNLSANSVSHADMLAKTGLPVAAVVPQDSPDRFTTPKGNRVVICPAQRVDGISCDKCRLCAKADRGFIVGFKPHGASSKAVNQIASN